MNLSPTRRSLNPDPPTREMDQLLSTGEIQTVSLFAMALAGNGLRRHQLYRRTNQDDYRQRPYKGKD